MCVIVLLLEVALLVFNISLNARAQFHLHTSVLSKPLGGCNDHTGTRVPPQMRSFLLRFTSPPPPPSPRPVWSAPLRTCLQPSRHSSEFLESLPRLLRTSTGSTVRRTTASRFASYTSYSRKHTAAAVCLCACVCLCVCCHLKSFSEVFMLFHSIGT